MFGNRKEILNLRQSIINLQQELIDHIEMDMKLIKVVAGLKEEIKNIKMERKE